MNIKLLVFMISVIMIGCETIPPPKEPNKNTLVVGRLVVDIAMGRYDIMSRLIGTHTGGVYSATISFYLKDENGGTTYITTQKDGWIISSKLSGGNYTIEEFVFEAEAYGDNHKMKIEEPFNITIEGGKVNNLGIIQINVLPPPPPYPQGRYSINDDKDFNTVKNDFKNNFPASGWDNYDWNDVSFGGA